MSSQTPSKIWLKKQITNFRLIKIQSQGGNGHRADY
jgi:hypothetical protein